MRAAPFARYDRAGLIDGRAAKADSLVQSSARTDGLAWTG